MGYETEGAQKPVGLPSLVREMCGSGAVEAGDDCIADHVGCLNGGPVGDTFQLVSERKEQFDRWSRTFFTFRSAPMTVLWASRTRWPSSPS